jgi:hypothetical protein
MRAMLRWLQRSGFPLAVWRAGLLSMTVALAACACSNRRGGQSPVATAVAAPTPTAPGPGPESPAVVPKLPCGLAGTPECPLQAWMDSRLNTALSTGDYPDVARAMRELAADSPEPFASWGSWAEQGAAAADRQDDAGIRKACSGCHDEARETYRRTMRDRPVRSAPSAPHDSTASN